VKRAPYLAHCIAAVLLLCSPVCAEQQAQTTNATTFTWHGDFSLDERSMLANWVQEAQEALTALVGPLPFPIRIAIHQRDSPAQPVPWAHTRRTGVQGVDFYVDVSHAAEAFRQDWTAPHELSHLVLPYLGRDAMWFAEGFASYMQFRVMQTAGILSAESVAARYRERLQRAETNYAHSDLPLPQATPRLRSEGNYPTLYWGGAVYFLRVDAALQQAGAPDLMSILRRYLACCRQPRSSPEALLDELDRLAGAPVFSDHYTRFQQEPGFPTYHDLLP